MNSLAQLTNAGMVDRAEPRKRPAPSSELVAAVAIALAKMKDAGLADYGGIPKDPIALAEKAETYAEALLPIPGEPFARAICPECVFAATDRICRAPAKKEGEQTPIPSSGEFRRACLDAWETIYRHIGVPVIQGGREVTSIVAVRRDASESAVSSALDRVKSRALSGGCRALPSSEVSPEPTSEVRARMHKMLGWEAPLV